MLPFILKICLEHASSQHKNSDPGRVVARVSGMPVIGMAMLFIEQLWKTLGFWTTKVVGHFKWGLMDYPSRT